MNDESSPLRAAEAWIARLSRNEVPAEELVAFDAWRRDPDNQRAWEALDASRKRVERYVVRPETGRFRVIDIWTGETAVIAMTAQDGMSQDDALHTARLLNHRTAGGDRSVLQ